MTVATVPRSRRLRGSNRLAAAERGYEALGWPCIPGAHALVDGDRACSCDRIGCPAPGAHPISAAWALQASIDPIVLKQWWAATPRASVILPTGRVFDVFDVPAASGRAAFDRLVGEGVEPGPVAKVADDRYLFFVATRGAPVDEDEWWSCHLDCVPENIADSPGMRWHCRDSYVVAPPSVLPYGRGVAWIRPPQRRALPDPLRVLEVLADSCEL